MNRISIAMNATPTNVSLLHSIQKSPSIQQHIMSIDPPDIMFVEFFCKKYLSAKDKRPARIGCR